MMSAGWVSSLWGAADATADIHTPPIDDSEGREAEEAGKCGHGGYEDGNDNAGCGTAPEVRNETTLVNATASTSEGEAATSFSEGLRLTPRGRLLAAALVADSVASTASIFDSLHEDDTDFDTRALRRQTLSDFDKELMAAMPGQAFKDVDVLQSLPKLSRSFGMNVTAMWTAPEHIVDGETYLGSMSAIHNFYFQSQALNSAVSAVPAGATPDRKLSKEILNKLTLTYVRSTHRSNGAGLCALTNSARSTLETFCRQRLMFIFDMHPSVVMSLTASRGVFRSSRGAKRPHSDVASSPSLQT